MKTFQQQFDLLASYNDHKNLLFKQYNDNEITSSQYCDMLSQIDDQIVRNCPDIIDRSMFSSKLK